MTLKPTQNHKEIKKNCPYRAKQVSHNCHHTQNPKHICKAKNCPLLNSNRVITIKPNWGDSRPISELPRGILKSTSPLLIKTSEGLVQLKDWIPINQGWHGNLGKRRK